MVEAPIVVLTLIVAAPAAPVKLTGPSETTSTTFFGMLDNTPENEKMDYGWAALSDIHRDVRVTGCGSGLKSPVDLSATATGFRPYLLRCPDYQSAGGHAGARGGAAEAGPISRCGRVGSHGGDALKHPRVCGHGSGVSDVADYDRVELRLTGQILRDGLIAGYAEGRVSGPRRAKTIYDPLSFNSSNSHAKRRGRLPRRPVF